MRKGSYVGAAMIKIGQVWKRKFLNRYHLIHSWGTEFGYDGFYIKHLYGVSIGEKFHREVWYIERNYERVHPVICKKCGTARAHLNDDGLFARGLICWSCI